MPMLKVLGAVSGVSAQPPACAFGLLRGHFGCPAWAFSGASYYRFAREKSFVTVAFDHPVFAIIATC